MILMDQADTGDTVGAAGPCWYLLVPPVLTSLLATTALGDSLHGQGPALDTVVEGDTFFLVGVRSNTICLGMRTVSSWTEIPRHGIETDLLQVCDS